jgi:hypothetical protein
MNEELAMQHSVQNQLQPEPKKNPWPKRILMTVVVLVLIGGIGYGTAAAWRQYSNVQDSLKSEQAKNKALSEKNVQLQSQADEEPTVPQVTEALSDGKTISYGLTTDNSQILLWNQDGKVAISDKRALSYVSTVDAAVRKEVCTSTSADGLFNQMDISMGILDTTKKTVALDQDVYCLESLASSKNPNKADQAAAQAVLDKVYDNISQFVQSATIQ